MHCACGNRLVAVDEEEGLIRQTLTHAHQVHPEIDLTEGQSREMVASQASDTEEASC